MLRAAWRSRTHGRMPRPVCGGVSAREDLGSTQSAIQLSTFTSHSCKGLADVLAVVQNNVTVLLNTVRETLLKTATNNTTEEWRDHIVAVRPPTQTQPVLCVPPRQDSAPRLPPQHTGAPCDVLDVQMRQNDHRGCADEIVHSLHDQQAEGNNNTPPHRQW